MEDLLYPLLPAYDRLPHSVKHGLGRTFRRLPRRWRLGARYLEFRALAEEADGWDRARIEEYQFDQVRRTLLQAEARCPFYQRRFREAGFRPAAITEVSGLAACPTLSKSDLLAHREEIVATGSRARDRLYVTTGGSTGVPVGFYLERGVSRPKEQAFLEVQWKRAGYFDGARLAVLRGHVTSPRVRGEISSYDATRDWLMLSSTLLTEQRLPEYLAALERFEPDLLHAYPSAALQLADLLDRTGRAWQLPLRAVLCGSERLTPPQKRVLERVFGCRVFRWYGHAERVVLAAEGARDDTFFFWPQYGLAEFGPPDQDGLCEVIGTSFHNHAFPLVRYRTGDRVRPADPGRRPTELPWAAISEVAGRDQEYLVALGGRRVSLTAFNMHDRTFDEIVSVQFFQDRPGRAELRYVAGPRFDPSQLPHIEAGIRRKLGDDFEVELRSVRETEKTSRGKHRWLVSTL